MRHLPTRNRRWRSTLAVVVPLLAARVAGAAGPTLTYVPGSSVKLEQVIGDCDWQFYDWADQTGTCHPTTSRTVTRFNILGNGQGGSWEDNGRMVFFFGDTISRDVSAVNYHAHDPIAWSTTTDPEAGLLLNFFTNSDGSPLFVEPPGIKMGADDIPNAGITLADGTYLVCNTGSDASQPDPHVADYSVLVKFDETSQTFTAGRTISARPAGHFIATALHAAGSDVMMFGAGAYRASDIYLSSTPAASFASGVGTRYFTGLLNGQPTWSSAESDAVPVVQDNPLGGPAWPNDSPTVGNLSIAYSSDLGLWLMTYDGGRQSNRTRGVYFTYAQQPWGPWATPQLIFNDARDGAWGVFIHNPNLTPDPPGDRLNGPMIGSNDPYTSPGGGFAPLLIERFTRVSGNLLKIYYTLSTWNPYTVVKMRSELQIVRDPLAPCVPGAATLCIDDRPGDRRFEVTAQYSTNEGGGRSGAAQAVPLGSLGVDHGGLLWFFDATNPEMLVKVIDGCAVDQRFWLFFAAGTNAGFTLSARDTHTGTIRTYANPDLTAAAPVQDTAAFACTSAADRAAPAASSPALTRAQPAALAAAGAPTTTCTPDARTLCLANRFRVQVHYATTQGGSRSGDATAVGLSSLGVTQGGLFWFFGADNPEMLVKVIDGCAVNHKLWVFYSATTNVGFTVTVTDTQSGLAKSYTNADQHAAPPVQDTTALACPAS